MRKALALGIVAVLCAAAAFAASTGRVSKNSGEPITNLPNNDPQLIAAEKEARRTLPWFWALLEQNHKYADAFSLKAGFPVDRGNTDYLWLTHVQRVGDDVTGVLDNEPDGLPNLHYGSHVTIKESRVIDWLIVGEHGQYGHFTTRVLIKHDPRMAEAMKGVLSPDPLPPEFKTATRS